MAAFGTDAPSMSTAAMEWVEALIKRLMHEGHAWNMSALIYTDGDSIAILPNCFAFMFTNLGDTTAFVNGMVVFPSATPLTQIGDSRSVGAHWGDVYKGNLELKFQAPIGAIPRVEIVQLFYHPSTVSLSEL